MKDWKIILWLIVFNPVGLYKMYTKSNWSNWKLYTVTVIFGLIDAALIYSGMLFLGLSISAILIFLMGLISIISKKDKKSSMVMLIAGILLFAFSNYQVTVQAEQQAALEEQQQQKLLEKQEKEKQHDMILEATTAIEKAEKSRGRNSYIKANKLVNKLNFESPEISDLNKRLKVIDTELTREEKLKKFKLALEKAEVEQTEEKYKKAVSLMQDIDLDGTDFEERLVAVKEFIDIENDKKEELILALEEAEENKSREAYDKANVLLAELTIPDEEIETRLNEVETVIVKEEERVEAERVEEEKIQAKRAEEEKVQAQKAEEERVAAEQTVAAKQSKPKVDNISEEQGEVYITETGTKYHRGSCFTLKKSKIPSTLTDARALGFEACKLCH